MSKIYVYGATPEQMAEAVAAARALGGEPIAITADEDNAQAYGECGAQKVVALTGAQGIIENCAAQVANMIAADGACGFVSASCYAGQVLAAQVSTRLGWPMESDVTSVALDGDAVVAQRLLYGGAVSRQETIEGLFALTVSAGLFEPSAATCPVESVAAETDARIVVESVQVEQKEGSDITKAKRVVGVGMGIRTEDDLAVAKNLASAIGAEVGGTRGMCEERGFLPDYIGISGLTVQPDLYVSLAISGQIQHVFGIRSSKVIVACDKNPDAPIFKAADYGFVGDFKEFAEALANAVA